MITQEMLLISRCMRHQMVESSGSIHLTHRSLQRKLHIKQGLNSSMKCSMNVREAKNLNRSFSCRDL
jgi:hypothetical protein